MRKRLWISKEEGVREINKKGSKQFPKLFTSFWVFPLFNQNDFGVSRVCNFKARTENDAFWCQNRKIVCAKKSKTGGLRIHQKYTRITKTKSVENLKTVIKTLNHIQSRRLLKGLAISVKIKSLDFIQNIPAQPCPFYHITENE